MEIKWRLINSGYNNAAMNMAIDEALLISEKPVLRFYRWKPAALSLGFFQGISSINLQECKKNGIDVVRRITGGKTVLHDKELTYSLIIDEKLMPKSIIESYKTISRGILFALKEIGINAEMKEDAGKKIMHTSAICFNEPSYYEIIANNKKIVGSAQTRKNKKLLQHGSVLIDVDVEKLCSLFNYNEKNIVEKARKRITSINNELGKKASFEEVAEAMKLGFEKNFKCEFLPDKLTEDELMLAEKLAEEKYSTEKWNFLR